MDWENEREEGKARTIFFVRKCFVVLFQYQCLHAVYDNTVTLKCLHIVKLSAMSLTPSIYFDTDLSNRIFSYRRG